MIVLLQERLRGVVDMLAYRPGWRARFDVSPQGFWESFLAAIPALPFFILSILGQNAVSLALAEEGQARPVGLPQSLVLYAALWAYFPLVTRVFVRVFQLDEAYAPWVVVHNWTVLALLLMQGVIGGLLIAGILAPRIYVDIGSAYFLFAIYAHCRVAIGSLDAPWPLAVGGACVGILVWLIVQMLLAYSFAGAALQA